MLTFSIACLYVDATCFIACDTLYQRVYEGVYFFLFVRGDLSQEGSLLPVRH